MVNSPFSKNVYARNAELYKILAHPIRLEILNILNVQDASLEDLTVALEIPKANVSQHLAILKMARVVSNRRENGEAIYSIVNKDIVAPCKVLKDLWEKAG
jgi:DNA-binding transcriptional ArsR family regulator